MKKFKTKAIQADEGIFTHILAYSDIFKNTQSISILEASVTLTYLELWYIQNKKHILSRDILRTVAYLELWYIKNPVKHLLWSVFAKKVNEVLIRCKVWGLREPGDSVREFLIHLFVDIFN